MDMWLWLILAEARSYRDLVSDCVRLRDPTMTVNVNPIVYRIIVELYTVLSVRLMISLVLPVRRVNNPAGL
jgi:hypothetical protein